MAFRIHHVVTVLGLALGLAGPAAADRGTGIDLNIGTEIKPLATLVHRYNATCTEEALARAKKTQAPADYKKTLGYCEQLATTLQARGMQNVPDPGAPAGEFGTIKYPEKN